MIDGILGKKLEMSQKFMENGRRIPLTRIEAGPCVVVDVKTLNRDNYQAIVLGFGHQKASRLTKPLLGKLKKAGIKQYPAFLREIRTRGESGQWKAGKEIKVGDVFKAGDYVDISGISKGKGFAGVVKRWGFAGGPASHGQSDRLRAPGSIGGTTTPGRVYKGKKMAGRMGGVRKTVQNLEVVGIEAENNILEVKGAVPGARGRLVIIKKARKQLINVLKIV